MIKRQLFINCLFIVFSGIWPYSLGIKFGVLTLMTHTPQSLFQKIYAAHSKGGSVSPSVTLKATGRKPKGFENGHAIPGEAVKVPKELPLTHGAFGALAFRTATSVNNALSVRITFEGPLPKGIMATDLCLHVLRKLPALEEGQTMVIQLAGTLVEKLNIENRMTLCAQLSNGADVAAVIMKPTAEIFNAIGATEKEHAMWRPLHSDPDAEYDHHIVLQAHKITPQATWTDVRETSGGIETNLDGQMAEKVGVFEKGKPMVTLPIDLVYIGPFEDYQKDALESAVEVFRGRKVASGLTAFVIPGSKELKKHAESKGWDKTFIHSGCIWDPTPTQLEEHKRDDCLRCAETLPLVSTKPRHNACHFMSAQMAATAAICGRIADVRDFI